MKKIFAIGASGLVGSRIGELLGDKYTFQDLSTETGIDITNPETLKIIADDVHDSFVLHLAAKADVDGCEQDKPLGKEGAAYKVNVLGTQNVVNACKAANKKIIYISTDFVFDGENRPEGGYTEEDTPHPVNWYAQTKYEGEEVVRNSGLPFLIVRLSYPYRADEFAMKKDFVHAIMGRLKNGQPVAGITDHLFMPTFIDDIAKALDTLITKDATGIFHVVGSEALSPYDSALAIAERFGYDKSLISKTTREEYFKNKALRPFDLTLNNDKIEKLGVTMKTFKEGIELVL